MRVDHQTLADRWIISHALAGEADLVELGAALMRAHVRAIDLSFARTWGDMFSALFAPRKKAKKAKKRAKGGTR